MNTQDNDNRYLLQSAANTLDVLEAFAIHPELTINEVVELTGIGKSTVFRILYTLESKNYLSRTKNGAYQLGIKLFSLGKVVESQLGIINLAHPFLVDLAAKTGETAHLVIWKDKKNIMFIDKVLNANSSLRMDSYVGFCREAYLTASGKALLSTLSEEQLQSYIDMTEFVRHTDTTITSGSALRRNLEEIHSRGYAIDNEESEQGLVCMSTPIYDSFRHAIASISFSGPAGRMWANQERNTIALKRIAAALSAKL